jgi:hypothetical protein
MTRPHIEKCRVSPQPLRIASPEAKRQDPPVSPYLLRETCPSVVKQIEAVGSQKLSGLLLLVFCITHPPSILVGVG